MDPNIVDALKFLIWATAILATIHTIGLFFWDRWLKKKAWLARQKTGAARLEWLLLKRKIR